MSFRAPRRGRARFRVKSGFEASASFVRSLRGLSVRHTPTFGSVRRREERLERARAKRARTVGDGNDDDGDDGDDDAAVFYSNNQTPLSLFGLIRKWI